MKFLSFVVDLIDISGVGKKKRSNHYATLILEQSKNQVYWVSALDRHEHGQMNQDELNDYIDQLESSGYKQVEIDSIKQGDKRPPKYYIILLACHDWNIEEIVVINRFEDHPTLKQLVSELNLSSLTHRLMVEDWEETKAWVNDRGNFQLNHGSNHLDMRDCTKIVGMNIANDHKKPQRMVPGMDGDETMEDTLLRKQIVVTKMLDYIATLVNKQPIFQDKKRSKHFASIAMSSRGYDENSFRADAGAFLYSGLLKSRSNGVLTAQCKMHRDAHNDPRCENGANQSICYSEMMEMKFGNRMNMVFGRGALNQFMKASNGSTIAKYNATMELLGLVKCYMVDNHVIVGEEKNVDWKRIMENVKKVDRRERYGYAVVKANANKDCYYSWHTHVIFDEIMPVYGWNKYVFIEAIYAMSLTPSSIGWRKGVRYALLAKNNGKNFLTNFVNELVYKDGAVANHFKKKARHQVSSGGILGNQQAYVSLYNFLQLLEKANEIDCVTKTLYEDLGAHEFNLRRGRMRGLRNVKDLTAHDLINVSTKVGIVMNTQHIRNITIARNTETARRLKRFGITTDAHLREVVFILSRELGIDDYQIVENMICETLRRLEGGGGDRFLGVDTVAVDQPLYQFVYGVLKKTDSDGKIEVVNIEEMKMNNPSKEYAPRYEWWNVSPDNPTAVLGVDFDMILTKKSRVWLDYKKDHNIG